MKMIDVINTQEPFSKDIPLDWERWFAWYPVKVHEKYVWLDIIYRRPIFRLYENWKRKPKYIYGTLFDVIKG